MAKQELTLPPSEAAMTQGAVQIFAAYIAAGHVKNDDDVESWMKRSIREAFKIATTVDAYMENSETSSGSGGGSSKTQSSQPKPAASPKQKSAEAAETSASASADDDEFLKLIDEDAGEEKGS